MRTTTRVCACSSCCGGCTSTAQGRALLPLFRQCPGTYPIRSAKHWGPFISSTLQVQRQHADCSVAVDVPWSLCCDFGCTPSASQCKLHLHHSPLHVYSTSFSGTPLCLPTSHDLCECYKITPTCLRTMFAKAHAMLLLLCHASHLPPCHTSHISGIAGKSVML